MCGQYFSHPYIDYRHAAQKGFLCEYVFNIKLVTKS